MPNAQKMTESMSMRKNVAVKVFVRGEAMRSECKERCRVTSAAGVKCRKGVIRADAVGKQLRISV
jgi:hypothetical protein